MPAGGRLELLGQANRDFRNLFRGPSCNRSRDLVIEARGQASEKALDRSQKQELVDALHQTLGQASLVVVTQQSGLTVAEVTNLRRQMREAGAVFKVAKNRLVRRAVEGTPFEGLSSLLTGPTALAFSVDPVAAAKVAVEFANSNEKLAIMGGSIGTQILDPEGVKELAKLPSMNELRAKLIGVLQAPAAKIASVLQAPGGQLARVFSAYGAKGDAG